MPSENRHQTDAGANSESVALPTAPQLAWRGRGTRGRVMAAMSGGVDSSVAVALLVEQGYDVVGGMAHFWAEDPCDGTPASNKCCSPESEAIARQVCAKFDIPFYTVDLVDAFRHVVVEPFISEYLGGRTPNPCIDCNRDVKFGLLLEYALSQGADFIATGHYARVRRSNDEWLLLRGKDRQKDQSYMLYTLEQRHLAHTLFPVGELTKQQVRARAAAQGLAAAERPESQEICFIGDNDYRRFLREHAGVSVEPGPILDSEGRQIGTHKGLPFYTIGQREGLGIAFTEPLYVLEIRLKDNALVVGTARELGRDSLIASHAHFVSGKPPEEAIPVTAKIRYRATEVPAVLDPLDADRVRVRFDSSLRDITPGQAVVWYQDERLVGGGIIEA